MEEKVARRGRRRMGRSFDRNKWLQFLRPLVEVEAIPEVATDSNDA
jgi:hypothetical protein